ncbi:MAG: divergent PAP2 family protein [Clostridiales bacterium]|nr:divergent PAP2 family protein [Clostridiales bacterium]
MVVLSEIAGNTPFVAALLSFFAAQLIKIIIELWRVKKLNVYLLISSGGMPSSHSSFVTALTAAIGIREGFGSAIFAVSAVFAIVVMYDAAGVRRAAGTQAKVINMIVENIENQGVTLDKKLKELLGHSPVEVLAGAVLGVIIGIWRSL